MNYLIQLNIYEFFIWGLYVFIAFGFIYLYKAFNPQIHNNFLYSAFTLKIIGGLSFTLVYTLYYTEGDCNMYYYGARQLVNIFYEDPGLYFKLIFQDSSIASKTLIDSSKFVFGSHGEEEWFMIRMISPLNILSFNSYLGLTFYTSLISFLGAFHLFKIFIKILPNNEKQIFYLSFLVPSILFWGGGVLKDTFTTASFNFLIVMFYRILFEKKYNLLFWIIIPLLIIFYLKAYIVISFMIWLTISLLYFFINKSKNPVAKFLIVPYLGFIFISVGYIFSINMMNSSTDYKVDEIQMRIEGFKSWHTTLKGSAYDLGEMEFTPLGFLKMIPAGINVTLFRPYPWESGNVLALMNSLESMVILFITMLTIVKVGFFNMLSIIKGNSFLLGAFFFCLFYAYVIGITTYNFGALSRFKIPITSLFIFILLFSRKSINKEKV